jgi:hypothetical protein
MLFPGVATMKAKLRAEIYPTSVHLSGWGLGQPPVDSGIASHDQLVSALLTDGYSQAEIDAVIQMGAADSDLANLDAGAITFDELMRQLSGPAPYPQPTYTNPVVAAAGATASAASSMLSSPFGSFDLADPNAWNSILGIVKSIGVQLTAAAQQNPSDPTVVNMVTEYQGWVSQFSSAWTQAFGSSPNLSGLGFGPFIIGIGIAAIIAAVLYGLYDIYTWLQTRQVQAVQQTSQTQAQSQAAQVQAIAQAAAAGHPLTPAQIQALAPLGAPQPQPPKTDWTTWLQSNAMTIGLIAAAVLIVPSVVGKRR